MPRRVMHIAEVGLRVTDLPRMVGFYREVLGFEIIRESAGAVFLKAGELASPLGRGGHPQMLVLFDRQIPIEAHLTTLDHLAFEILLGDFEAEVARLERLGLEVHRREFGWMHGRSAFFSDPDGNTVEIIAYDPAVASH